MSYSSFYTDRRVRSFRQRKGLGDPENRVQAVFAALSVALLVIVGAQYVSAQRELSFERVQYANVVEAK